MVLFGSTATAQSDHSRIRNGFAEELQKTDRVIEQARIAINRNNNAYDSYYLRIANQQAEKLVLNAIALQNQAKIFDNVTSSVADIIVGEKKTLAARGLAIKAITIKKRAEGKVEENEHTILRQLEKTDRLIERLRENAPANVPDRLKSAFDTALENQRRAWELFRERALRASLKLSRQTEKTLEKLGEHIRAGNTENRRLENQIARAEQKLEQTRLEIKECNSDEARELISRADQEMSSCHRYLSENENEMARNSLKNAQRLMQRAARLCSDNQSVNRAVARLEADIKIYSGQIIAGGDPNAIGLLESAGQHLRDAKRLCESGENEACAASVKAAQMNLRKALRLTGN